MRWASFAKEVIKDIPVKSVRVVQKPQTGWHEETCGFDSLTILVYPFSFLSYSLCIKAGEQMGTCSWLCILSS